MLINLSVKYKSPFFFCFVFLVRIVSDQSAQIGERLIEDYLNEQAEKDSRSFSLSNQVFNRSSTDNEESVQLSASILQSLVSDQSAQIEERMIEDNLDDQAEKDSRSFSLSNQVFYRSTDNEESVQQSASIGGSQLDTFADINMLFDKVIYFNLIHLEYFESIMLNSLDSELRRTASWQMSTLLH